MNPSDKEEFALVIAGLAETFRTEVSAATFYGYDLALNDLSIAAIKGAAVKAMRTSKFMPSAAELRELAGVAGHQDRAQLAWITLEKTVSRVGSYKSVDFEDGVINATVRSLGGWEYVCGLPGSEFDKWLRISFLKSYTSLSRAEVAGESCRPLAGITETENAANGYPSPEPIRIGGLSVSRPAVEHRDPPQLPQLPHVKVKQP